MRFGWVPAAAAEGADEGEEARFMSGDDMERVAREKWTRRGIVVRYD